MSYPQFDRRQLKVQPLRSRRNKLCIERDHVKPDAAPEGLSPEACAVVEETAQRVVQSRRAGRPVILAFGAHTIKNGLAPVLIRLMEKGWVTHLATNGAGIIHDWEFSYLGESGEDVRANVHEGTFGIWEETGRYLNLALIAGAWGGMGYGESVGCMIEREGLAVPALRELEAAVQEGLRKPGAEDRAAAAMDWLGMIRALDLKPGMMAIPHPWKRFSVQAAAYRLRIPFTGHPMIGHDIIYNHPVNHGAAIGRTALRDFLAYARSVQELDGGVYLSVGSAVMSPMIFEKALSMAQNLHLQAGRRIENHFIAVVDLAESSWDWTAKGEPPMDNPAYYLRYCKTFSRMGGTMRYASADNRDFLLALLQKLQRQTPS
ncbi:MAG: hypothetical protein A2498_11310 [Lentisphaerae bacterium RIFOXYC12_FULL_60_16]|nr:MAG: hypothetical protein A2498_11310 [Lentisphaerae bacterium RIFOXYC12_FULL_60_16]OGV73823.1 MAG: hypothetical protein A2269_08020 [Lentisphaerae bacterium RIFOXYA12_FULL_60_10]OGV85979.1 MAG: hypothetical protein A2340_16335 [Lentisphaerae bacterium RIFOXYB12_FULL_60_10]